MKNSTTYCIGGHLNGSESARHDDIEILSETKANDGEDGLIDSLMRTVEGLKSHNDNPLNPRPIQHFAYFDSMDAAKSFAKHLIDDEYVAVTVLKVDAPQWRVDFYNPGIATLEYLVACCGTVRAKVIEFGGEYDGWELPTMPEVLEEI
ncbi:ribonuclease E inhibitor RraB [Paraburkholderia phytofirmans]|uniref:ribonuclease E inhibitor RraB n=1 Tax=Paraburkholderia phytofirmans TaxID=261302 RepID=UPI0038BC6275